MSITSSKKKKWLYLMPFLLVVIALLMSLSLIYGAGATYTGKLIAGSLVFAAFPAVAISLSGYFDRKILLFISFSGLILAFIAMLVEFSVVTGWQDLSGIMMFMIIIIVSIITGAVIEWIAYAFKKLKAARKQ